MLPAVDFASSFLGQQQLFEILMRSAHHAVFTSSSSA